jgi:allantoinase
VLGGHGVTAELLVRSRRVLTTAGIVPATVRVRDGRIAEIASYDAAGGRDFGDAVIMPGVVDTHAHVNEPGRTVWEGFTTATRAAAAGGGTTMLDMPLNSIPATTTVAALDAKRAAAADHTSVRVEFIGGVVPGNAGELAPLWKAGVRAFKCFLVPSGVDEFPHVREGDLRQALPVLAQIDAPLMVHAELPERIGAAPDNGRTRYATYLASRPASAEVEAIELVARLAAEYEARVHIVHVSSAEGIAAIRAARRRGVRMTAETCPHYLTFAAEEIPDGATELKCAPPIRDASTRDALWSALEVGDLDMIVSDHSPCPPALKRRDTGDFFAAWGGISSLQLGLAAVWTGARGRGIDVARVSRWMTTAPARLAGLSDRTGALEPGKDADIVVWDPDASRVVTESGLYHRHTLTPYLGHTLYGVVCATFAQGRLAFDDSRHA